MKPARRRWRRPLLAVAALILAAFAVHSLVGPPPTPLLTSVARRIARDDSWGVAAWATDNTYIYVRKPARGSLEVARLDAATGTSTRLAAPTAAIATLKTDGRWLISPDGRWLLVKQTPSPTQLISLDSGSRLTRPAGGAFIGWLADSSGWLETSGIKGDWTLRLRRPATGAAETLPRQPAVNGDTLAISPDCVVLTGLWNPYGREDLVLTETDARKAVITRTRHVPLPPDALVSGAAVSPDWSRLVWQTRPAFHLLDIILRPGTWEDTVWVSRLGGSAMRALGRAPSTGPHTDYDSDLACPEWLPSSRALAFTYHGFLYKLGAP